MISMRQLIILIIACILCLCGHWVLALVSIFIGLLTYLFTYWHHRILRIHLAPPSDFNFVQSSSVKLSV